MVCAVSLVGQWMEEARSKLNGSLRMYQYHGQGRNRDVQSLATDYDLVVTTYQVFPAEDFELGTTGAVCPASDDNPHNAWLQRLATACKNCFFR